MRLSSLAAFLSRHFFFEKTKIYTKFRVTFWSKTRHLSTQEKKKGEEPTELQNLLNTWFHFDGSMHNFHFYIDCSQQRLMAQLIDSSFNLINYNKYASGFQLLKYL